MTAANDFAEVWRTNLRFYVHVKAGNGQVIWTPGQGFVRRRSALRSLARSRPDITDIRYVGP